MTFAGIVKSAGAASLVALLAVTLAGCGRRGELEAPGVPVAAHKAQEAPATKETPIDNTGGQSKATSKAIAPKRDFVLDPLL